MKEWATSQPTTSIQIAAKTQDAYDLMAGRLAGVIFWNNQCSDFDEHIHVVFYDRYGVDSWYSFLHS